MASQGRLPDGLEGGEMGVSADRWSVLWWEGRAGRAGGQSERGAG